MSQQELANLPDGVWVKFRYFLDCRDALLVRPVGRYNVFLADTSQALRSHDHYRVEQHSPEEILQRIQSVTPPSATPKAPQRRPLPVCDLKSIFVSDVPVDINHRQIDDLFSVYGAMTKLVIIRRPLPSTRSRP